MIIVLAATVASMIAIMVAHGMGSWEHVKANWNDYRCNPMYMPVAGFVRPDVDTGENFVFCTNAMAAEFYKIILDQVQSYFGVLTGSLASMLAPLGLFHKVVSNIRGFMLTFAKLTLSKVASSMSVFLHYLNKIRDVLKRFVSEGYIGAYLAQVIVDFVWSFVTLFISIIKTFVYILLAIAVILALFNPVLLALAITLAALIAASGF